MVAVASNDFTVAPNSGGRCSSATSMSGKVTSMVNWAVPLVLGGTSTRGNFWPMSLKSFGSFSGTSFGTGRPDALAANAPNVA